MAMNSQKSAAIALQAEWRTAPLTNKMKIAQQTQKLGVSCAVGHMSMDDLTNIMNLFQDRELKISFLTGFEAAIAAHGAVMEELKTYLHYEKLRHKRIA